MYVICFDIFGDFAHFRPYDTTSSPITYTMLPPTTLFGILGAILGFGKEEYELRLKQAKTRIGIALNTEARKWTTSVNLINTKGNYWVPTNRNSNGPRTPTRYEFLVNPSYRIFVTMADNALLNELENRVREHTPVYTISLGLAGLIADLRYCFSGEAQKTETLDYIQLSTAISILDLEEEDAIDLNKGLVYAKERFVSSFGENREPEEFVDVLYSLKGGPVWVKTKQAYKLNEHFFTFLN